MSKTDSKSLMVSHLNKILLDHLEKTVSHIHSKYKKYFTEKDVKEVLEMIKSDITFQDMGSEELEDMDKKVTKKIIERQVYNSGIYKNKHTIPEDDERCHARIWANGCVESQEDVFSDDNTDSDEDDNQSADKSADKSVDKSADKSVDKSANKSNNKITFGKRCSRRINDTCPHHKYCGHHMKNNPHGDYNYPLKKFQTLNFVKNSKALNRK
tara:strand:+ start:148 stop:783 length:636 start_codon:yes stop_codon:yes gene_type:complete